MKTLQCGRTRCNKMVIPLETDPEKRDEIKKQIIRDYIKTAKGRKAFTAQHVQPLKLVNYCTGCLEKHSPC